LAGKTGNLNFGWKIPEIGISDDKIPENGILAGKAENSVLAGKLLNLGFRMENTQNWNFGWENT
jgi:hypothetical protein